eukprot:5247688-Pleurochrysis_carterae.AAC.1
MRTRAVAILNVHTRAARTQDSSCAAAFSQLERFWLDRCWACARACALFEVVMTAMRRCLDWSWRAHTVEQRMPSDIQGARALRTQDCPSGSSSSVLLSLSPHSTFESNLNATRCARAWFEMAPAKF